MGPGPRGTPTAGCATSSAQPLPTTGSRDFAPPPRSPRTAGTRSAGIDVEEDVHVEIDKGRLVIHGERRDERAGDPQNDGRILREVRYGSFRCGFKLPAHVRSEAISAAYEAGVLTVRVAGAYKGAEPPRIAIETR